MILQWRVPKFRDYLPPPPHSPPPTSYGHDKRLCKPTLSGPRSTLGFSTKDTNRIRDASIPGHETLGLRPLAQRPVQGNNSRNFSRCNAKTAHGNLWLLPLDPVSILDPPRLELVWDGKLIQPIGMLQTGLVRDDYTACSSGTSWSAQQKEPGRAHRFGVSCVACRTEFRACCDCPDRTFEPSFLADRPAAQVGRVRGTKILGISSEFHETAILGSCRGE